MIAMALRVCVVQVVVNKLERVPRWLVQMKQKVDLVTMMHLLVSPHSLFPPGCRGR